MTNFSCGDHDLVKCFAIDYLLITAWVRQLTISEARLVCKLRVYCKNSIYSLWYLAVNSLWRNQHSALLESRATFRKANALRRIWPLYAVERCAVTEFRVLCLPMNALCRSAALLLKCMLIVYIRQEKGVRAWWPCWRDVFFAISEYAEREQQTSPGDEGKTRRLKKKKKKQKKKAHSVDSGVRKYFTWWMIQDSRFSFHMFSDHAARMSELISTLAWGYTGWPPKKRSKLYAHISDEPQLFESCNLDIPM